MSKASLETEIRNEMLNKISTFLDAEYDSDVLAISASELCIPVVDSQGNETFAIVKVSIPRGKRVEGGYIPFDGYAAASDWEFELNERAEKIKAREEKKIRQEKEADRRRAARRTIKNMKKEVQEIFTEN